MTTNYETRAQHIYISSGRIYEINFVLVFVSCDLELIGFLCS